MWYNETVEPLFTTEVEVDYSTTTTTTSYKSTNPVTPERGEKTLIPAYDVYVYYTIERARTSSSRGLFEFSKTLEKVIS